MRRGARVTAFIWLTCLCIADVAWPSIAFTDISAQSGVDFRHTDGRTGELHFPETIGSGCALFDYDNDGWLDLYLVNAGDAPGREGRDAAAGANRLYRNAGDGTFIDVTDAAGVGDTGYGVGVCVGDYDNDGWEDLFVTGFGGTTLYRNRGNGEFDDVTASAGVYVDRWTTAAAFGDLDADGDLDLYVARYCVWTLDEHRVCHEHGHDVYCGPEEFEGDADVLFINRGDGTFEDATQRARVTGADGKGLGVLILDHDGDGDEDIYVACDGTPNLLYSSLGDGTFEDVGWLVGTDGDDAGNPQGSMGVDFGDYNGDGLLDLIVTNFQRQYNTVYRNDGDGFFADVSFIVGLGQTLPDVSWGTAFFDADNDGWSDLFVANGHIQTNIADYDPTSTYRQRNRLYRNSGSSGFVDVTSTAGDGLQPVKASRGTAFGDIDNDGDVDVVVSNASDAPDILRNDTVGGAYLLVDLVGRRSNASGIGAHVRASAGDLRIVKEARSGGSYVSHNDLRVHIGLGSTTSVDLLEVTWPSGVVDTMRDVAANRQVRVVEGVGIATEGP
jgi:enediyne biosynthesis protein E4